MRRKSVLYAFGFIFLLCVVCMIFVDRPVLMMVHSSLPRLFLIMFKKIQLAGLAHIWFILFVVLTVYYQIRRYFARNESERIKKRDRAYIFLFMLSAMIVGGVFVGLGKFFFGRFRPCCFLSDRTFGFLPLSLGYENSSFPSGHAQVICSAMTACLFVFRRYRFAFFILAILVCSGRILTEEHFLSDVIMGAFIGIVTCSYVYVWFVREGYLKVNGEKIS